MARTKQWKTRDGRKVRVMDMDDRHLVNTIHLLQRYHEAATLREISVPGPNGDMAQDCWEREMDAIIDSEVGDRVPIYDDMVEEATRRGLTFRAHYYEGVM